MLGHEHECGEPRAGAAVGSDYSPWTSLHAPPADRTLGHRSLDVHPPLQWNINCSCPDDPANPNPFCHFVNFKTGKCVTYAGAERKLSLSTCGAFEKANTKQAWEISIESGWDN